MAQNTQPPHNWSYRDSMLQTTEKSLKIPENVKFKRVLWKANPEEAYMFKDVL